MKHFIIQVMILTLGKNVGLKSVFARVHQGTSQMGPPTSQKKRLIQKIPWLSLPWLYLHSRYVEARKCSLPL